MLDIENFSDLRDYLRRTGRIGAHESVRLTNLAGGVSNRTVLLERSSGEAWVLKQALSQLRVRVEWLSDPRRIEREAAGMKRLLDIAGANRITPPIFLEPAEHLLAMAAVPQPHTNWKTMLLRGEVKPAHVEQFARLLGTIHRQGVDDAATGFDDRSFFESLRLEPYYSYSAQRMPAVAGFIHDLVAETRATRYTLVHGDYSPKNVLVHEGNLILLDHEVIHFGDGAFDVGFALTHLLSKANALPKYRDQFADAAKQFWEIYSHSAGPKLADAAMQARSCRHTMGCMLARCIGRSPLEYLKPPEAAVQANAASALMDHPPTEIAKLVDEFIRRFAADRDRGFKL